MGSWNGPEGATVGWVAYGRAEKDCGYPPAHPAATHSPGASMGKSAKGMKNVFLYLPMKTILFFAVVSTKSEADGERD